MVQFGNERFNPRSGPGTFRELEAQSVSWKHWIPDAPPNTDATKPCGLSFQLNHHREAFLESRTDFPEWLSKSAVAREL